MPDIDTLRHQVASLEAERAKAQEELRAAREWAQDLHSRLRLARRQLVEAELVGLPIVTLRREGEPVLGQHRLKRATATQAVVVIDRGAGYYDEVRFSRRTGRSVGGLSVPVPELEAAVKALEDSDA
ncbi:MAG TPA: hypothetical protein VEI97_14435 [bacterium]|nr:hypothetical protein [bacterium]